MCIFCSSSRIDRRQFIGTSLSCVLVGSAFPGAAATENFSLPGTIAGVRIPDTQLAKDSALLMRSTAPPSLYNHCLRTFVLGMISATKQRLEIDEEMAFHASILHDLALTEAYHGDLRLSFEENSAHFAAAFARAAGVSDERADNVFRAILLHAGKAEREPPDVAFRYGRCATRRNWPKNFGTI